MEDDKLLYLAYDMVKELLPEEYSDVTIEEFNEYFTDEKRKEFETLLGQMEEQKQDSFDMMKSGGKLQKLQKLQEYKKGGKMKTKKCSCGCDLIEHKAEGGKITMKCACGCKAKSISDKVTSMNSKPLKFKKK